MKKERHQPLADPGMGAATAASKAMQVEAELMPMPDDPQAILEDAENKVESLRADHPQRPLLKKYIEAAHHHLRAGDDADFKYHLVLIRRSWTQTPLTRSSQTNKKIASLPRNPEVAAIINRLARRDEWSYPPKELWSEFIGKLEGAKEVCPNRHQMDTWSVNYKDQTTDKNKTMTYRTFENRIAKARKK